MESSVTTTGARVHLRGYERLATLVDEGSSKIVHAMALHANADATAVFLRHLPQALGLTFNRHPRHTSQGRVRHSRDPTTDHAHRCV